MDQLKEYAKYLIQKSDCDGVAMAVIDFSKNEFRSFEYLNEKETSGDEIYFDLASLTKPLTNSFIYLLNESELSDEKFQLLLNHKAGIPSWGLLSKKSWKEQVSNYKIQNSDTEYSDFSALKMMLEVQKKLNIDYEKYIKGYLDPEIIFWKDLENQKTVQNGFINGRPNFKKVHDPNALNLNCFTSHAGLFGTVNALSRTLLELNVRTSFIDRVSKSIEMNSSKQRFHFGFDTVSDLEKTLAGKGCSKSTFGHLGFTGTSFWIDPEKKIGHILLTNSTKRFWYARLFLAEIRRKAGEYIWQNYQSLF